MRLARMQRGSRAKHLRRNLTAHANIGQPDQAVHVSVREKGQVLVTAEERQRAVTPGQSMVFYHGEVCLGGAICDQVLDAGQVG